MPDKIPKGFRPIKCVSCASCKFIMQYPSSNEFYCSKEDHFFTVGTIPALDHYVCDDHEPPIGKWGTDMVGNVTIEEISDASE